MLPTPINVALVLGLPAGVRQLLKALRDIANPSDRSPLPLDDKTLRKGVAGLSTASHRKLWPWILMQFQALRGVDFRGFLRCLKSYLGKPVSTVAWRAMLCGAGDAARAWPRTAAFIQRRCDLEDDLIASLKPGKDPADIAARLRRTLQATSLIPAENLTPGLEALAAWVSPAIASDTTPAVPADMTPDLASASVRLVLDRWLQFAAVVEIEWGSREPVAFPAGLLGDSGGVLGHIWPTVDRSSGCLLYPAERLFRLLREHTKPDCDVANPPSWRSFADRLPALDKSDPSTESKDQLLRLWRKESEPSDKHWAECLAALQISEADRAGWTFLKRLAYGLDRRIRALRADPGFKWPMDPEPLFGEIFDVYPRYLEAMACGPSAAEPQAGISETLAG
jgi:hypothetical protein